MDMGPRQDGRVREPGAAPVCSGEEAHGRHQGGQVRDTGAAPGWSGKAIGPALQLFLVISNEAKGAQNSDGQIQSIASFGYRYTGILRLVSDSSCVADRYSSVISLVVSFASFLTTCL